MVEIITAVNQAVNNFIWGVPAMICILGVGMYLSIRTGFLQIRKFPYAIRTTIGRMFRKKDASDGSYKIVYLGDGISGFYLELTWLRDHPGAYDLGEKEFHLAFRTDDFENTYERHKKMGIICYENPKMGVYFIEDPDGYWLEIVRLKKQEE